MTEILVKQMPSFKKSYKKLHQNQKQVVNDAIKAIIASPHRGDEKKGDLAGVFVYKFKVIGQEYLLAYEWDEINRILMALGVHESFYRDLKR